MATSNKDQTTLPMSAAALAPSSAARSVVRFLLLLVIAGLLAFWMSRKFNGADPEGGLAVGQMAPPISAAGWLNGAGPEPKDLQGKVVLISAWGNHCPWCEKEAPELVALHKQFKDQVVFIGLTGDGLDELRGRNFVERHNLTWPNGYAAIETLTGLECWAYPMEWIIGADGKIAWNTDSKRRGGISLEEGLKQALAAAEKS